MTYDFTPASLTRTEAREILETLWDLEDLHRELISRANVLVEKMTETAACQA